MGHDPQDERDCPKCSGTGRIECTHSCSECDNDGECKAQDAQEFTQTCPMCEGGRTVSGDGYRSYMADRRDDAA